MDSQDILLFCIYSLSTIILATFSAVENMTSAYFRVANDYGMEKGEILRKVTFPAIAPQIITTRRVTAGLPWHHVEAAEMIAGIDGRGYAIRDARTGLQDGPIVSGMIVAGPI